MGESAPGLTEGKYDAVFNQIEDKPDRRALYDFSVAYLSSTPVLLVRSSGEDQIRTFSDIKDKRVGLNPTGIYKDMAKKHGAEIVPIKYISDANKLANGELDAVISDQLSVTNLKQFPNLPVVAAESADQVSEISAPL